MPTGTETTLEKSLRVTDTTALEKGFLGQWQLRASIRKLSLVFKFPMIGTELSANLFANDNPPHRGLLEPTSPQNSLLTFSEMPTFRPSGKAPTGNR